MQCTVQNHFMAVKIDKKHRKWSSLYDMLCVRILFVLKIWFCFLFLICICICYIDILYFLLCMLSTLIHNTGQFKYYIYDCSGIRTEKISIFNRWCDLKRREVTNSNSLILISKNKKIQSVQNWLLSDVTLIFWCGKRKPTPLVLCISAGFSLSNAFFWFFPF